MAFYFFRFETGQIFRNPFHEDASILPLHVFSCNYNTIHTVIRYYSNRSESGHVLITSKVYLGRGGEEAKRISGEKNVRFRTNQKQNYEYGGFSFGS